MSVSVSGRMTRVKTSATGALLARAKALLADGYDIVSLAAGEPDFDTPDAIKAAAIAAIQRGDTKYTPVDGSAELKAAIVAKFARENSLDYDPKQVVISNGAKQCIFSACIALLEEGTEAIVPAPYWVSYPDMVRLAGAEPVIVDAGIEQGFKLTAEQLADALTERTRLLILNSPSNPTGAAYTLSELQALGAVLEDYPDVVVIADDIYEHVYWADEPFRSFAKACPALYERTLTVNGVSKAYAMTGWRIGYVAGPESIIAAIRTVQSQSTSNPCSVSQAAAVEALNGDQAPVRTMCAAYHERHNYVVDALNELSGFECRPGEGTFYAFPRVSGAMQAKKFNTDSDLAEFLIEKAGVVAVPGSAFGAPGHLRLSFASSMEDLERAIGRIKSALSA